MKKASGRKSAKSESGFPILPKDAMSMFIRTHQGDPKIAGAFAIKRQTHHGPVMNTRKPHLPHG